MIYKRGCDRKGADGTCSKCGERGSCGVYWYKFMWHGKLVRESTKQGNDKVARQMESAHRTSLAKGEVGIRDKKPIPTLGSFLTERVLPWAEATFATSIPKNAKWYRNECRVLKGYKPVAAMPLDQINSAHVGDFAAWRIKQGRAVSTVNSSIRVLRRALSLAVEWGVLTVVPKLKVLSGALRREHVVTPEEEKLYLATATEPLRSIASVLVDSGLRPEECFCLQWEFVRFLEDGNGALIVTHGKSAAARRHVPMTSRVYDILRVRWESAGKPDSGWVWPAPKAKAGHIVPNSIYEPHLRAVADSKVRPFVLYDLRHTFLTRLGESGCDAWTLARIAGHSSVAVSQHYVHASDNAVLDAIGRLGTRKGGHKSGHRARRVVARKPKKLLVSASTTRS
ncbi:MAG: tyrosine-type recombinase/integrase [Candidatus Binataceae bacterium]